MALDGAFLYAVRQELSGLIGSRIEKIHQPAREEILISLRNMEGSHKILISASADRARVHLTQQSIDNPPAPPMFCMLLRKRLGNGKLLAIRQDGLERVLYFDFSCVNTLGDVVQLTLACEIMGKYSNLILIDETGKVVDSIKRVDAEMSRKRLVLPGVAYALPPAEPRLNFLTDSMETIQAAITAQTGALPKVLLKTLEGVSPVLVREWAFFAGNGEECRAEALTAVQLNRLLEILQQTKERLLQQNCVFTVAATKEGQLKDFSFLPLHQYGTLLITKTVPSACAVLDYFYAERDSLSRIKQKANDLFKLLINTSDRTQRRVQNQREELKECKDREKYRIYGDLITSNLYALEKGMAYAEVQDFYDENCPTVKIPLDKRLTPTQNAQKYYKEYRKLDTAEKKLTVLIAEGEQEVKYLDSVFDSLTRAQTEGDIAELREELFQEGYVKRSKFKGKPPKALPPIRYRSSDGYEIRVGRNNKQNDRLTCKEAEKTDLWLHVKDITGSHVIVTCDGEMPPDRTIEEAAIIAACNSKGRNSSRVDVDYTFIRNVKKPNGSKPGMVIFTNNYTITVKPDTELEEKLRV